MSNTMTLILECLMLLLEAEETRCTAETKEHRHALVTQANLNQIDRLNMCQCSIDKLLNPPEETKEDGAKSGSDEVAEVTTGKVEDSE